MRQALMYTSTALFLSHSATTTLPARFLMMFEALDMQGDSVAAKRCGWTLIWDGRDAAVMQMARLAEIHGLRPRDSKVPADDLFLGGIIIGALIGAIKKKARRHGHGHAAMGHSFAVVV
jgi:hypothetical protein